MAELDRGEAGGMVALHGAFEVGGDALADDVALKADGHAERVSEAEWDCGGCSGCCGRELQEGAARDGHGDLLLELQRRAYGVGVCGIQRGREIMAMGSMKQETTGAQDAARIALGATLVLSGTSHLTIAREPFKAQVPPWMPVTEDTVVLGSGVAEIALGLALIAAPKALRPLVGCAAAGFFTAIFPGNIAQWQHRRDAFGLDTDAKRFGRLFGQPVLLAWALWSTGAVPTK